jgi:hypothetical protein
LKYFNQALQLSAKLGDRRVEATTLNNIGLVYGSISQTQEALVLWLLPIGWWSDREATTLSMWCSVWHFPAAKNGKCWLKLYQFSRPEWAIAGKLL